MFKFKNLTKASPIAYFALLIVLVLAGIHISDKKGYSSILLPSPSKKRKVEIKYLD